MSINTRRFHQSKRWTLEEENNMYSWYIASKEQSISTFIEWYAEKSERTYRAVSQKLLILRKMNDDFLI